MNRFNWITKNCTQKGPGASRIRFFFSSAFALWGASIAWSTSVFSGVPFVSSASSNDEFLAKALQIRVTESGLDFLQLNIEEILRANGFDLRTQQKESLDLSLSSPIRLDSISAEFQGEKTTLADIAHDVSQWIQGIELKNPQPRFHLDSPSYEIRDLGGVRAYFKVRPNFKATQEIDARDSMGGGVLFDIEALIPELRLSANSLSVRDPQNPILGLWVLTSPEVRLGSAEKPLLLKLRLKVSGGGNGQISVEVLGASSNLSAVPVVANFQSLSVPSIKVTVNNKSRYLLDQRAIESELRSHMADFARLARGSVATSLRGGLQKTLSERINQWIVSSDIGVADLEIPGLCDGIACRKNSHFLRLGLGRADLGYGTYARSDEVDLRLRFFSDWKANLAADPLSRTLRGLDAAVSPEDELAFDDSIVNVPDSTHAVVTIDPRIYNFVLQDSWDAGWRPAVKGYEVLAAPQVRLQSLKGLDQSFLDIPLGIRPQSVAERQLFGNCGVWGATDDSYRVDAAVRLLVATGSQTDRSIDLYRSGLSVPDTYISPSQFSDCAVGATLLYPSDEQRRQALSRLVDSRVRAISAELDRQPVPLVQGLNLPESLLGVQLQVTQTEWLNGRIVLHLTFKGVAE